MSRNTVRLFVKPGAAGGSRRGMAVALSRTGAFDTGPGHTVRHGARVRLRTSRPAAGMPTRHA